MNSFIKLFMLLISLVCFVIIVWGFGSLIGFYQVTPITKPHVNESLSLTMILLGGDFIFLMRYLWIKKFEDGESSDHYGILFVGVALLWVLTLVFAITR